MIAKNKDEGRTQPSIMDRVAENTAAYFEAAQPKIKEFRLPEDDPDSEQDFMDMGGLLVDSFTLLAGDAQDVDDGGDGDVDEGEDDPAGLDGVKTIDLANFRCGSFQRAVGDDEAVDDGGEDDVDEEEDDDESTAFFDELARADEEQKARKVEAPKTDDANSDDPQKRLFALTARANGGDAEAIAGLRQILDEHPEIWQKVGDLGTHAELALIGLIADGDQLVVESVRRHARQLRNNLITDQTSQIERLAVQRVVACWLHTQHTDRLSANADAGQNPSTLWARRQEIAEKRYLTAIKSLKLVQKMIPQPTTTAVPAHTTEAETKTTDAPKPPVTSATNNCTDSSNGQHADHSQNGYHNGSPAHRPPPLKVVPKANGKPLNRMAAAVNGTDPILVPDA